MIVFPLFCGDFPLVSGIAAFFCLATLNIKSVFPRQDIDIVLFLKLKTDQCLIWLVEKGYHNGNFSIKKKELFFFKFTKTTSKPGG
tara:strand:- start:1046 stop:1303 length:258 start_codon:yes stop_codon:yes gene_type:complete